MSDEEIWKRGVDLSYVIDAYKNLNIGDHFFRPFFELLVGTDYVRKMIIEGKSAEEIKNRWKGDVDYRKSYKVKSYESCLLCQYGIALCCYGYGY
jgi:hypothetical protein